MTSLERFRAVCHFERPDYVPIFGFRGAPGMSRGAMAKTHQRLVETGMPEWVDGWYTLGTLGPCETWKRYWGTTDQLYIDFYPARGGYFPNGDHGIQPLATFESLCKFMTLLHEVTANPEGEFRRIRL